MEQTKLSKIIAPDKETKKRTREKIYSVSYYFIIAILSLIILFFVPFLTGGITGDFKTQFPSDAVGWTYWGIIRGGIVTINLCIFGLFKGQAKINIKDEPDYLLANEILRKALDVKERKPRSPAKMNSEEWLKKGGTLTLTSALTLVTIGSLILNFDVMTFLSCLLTVLMGVIFGFITMRKNELYWCEEYLDYARLVEQEIKEAQNAKNSKQRVQEHPRTSRKKQG